MPWHPTECHMPNALGVQAGWKLLFKLGDSEAGRHELSQALGLCSRAAPRTSAEVEALAEWLQGAWDYLAMGNCE